MVWTEAFADCDAPRCAVRWLDPIVTTRSGSHHRVGGGRVNYQSVHDGGCSTSNSYRDAAGIVQETGVSRRTPHAAYVYV